MKTIGKIGVVILLLSIICIAVSHRSSNPSWMETYRFDDDTIIVVEERRMPDRSDRMVVTEGMLVVQIRAKSGWRGGWGCSAEAPAAGARVYGAPKEEFAVVSFVSNYNGRVPFNPFVTQGHGRKGAIGGHRKGGFVKLLLFKRGFRLEEVPGRVNTVQESRIRVYNLRASSPVKSGVDDILKLLCPFDFADAEMQRAYWSHLLPNGSTLRDFALDELKFILETIADAGEQVRAKRAIERIEGEQFDSYPTNPHRLGSP